jgi:DICT domain-containing protein/predicted DNA-binding transcriptional regulator AlpA
MTTNPPGFQGSRAEQPGDQQPLTIGELARRTGLTAATLRTWETRHGFPRPVRRGSGHRRYRERDVALVQEVLRLRDAGVRLDVAIREALAGETGPAASVYITLRRLHPHLQVQTLRKSTLVPLCRAMEDECCARAVRPRLYGGFQNSRFFAQSALRWHELARTARSTTVFTDRETEGGDPSIRLVPLPDDAPLRREWVLVCDAADYPAALAAWELPGQDDVPDRDRRFECVWTLEPRAVRDAARACQALADRLDPAGAADEPATPDPPPDPPPEPSVDLRQATGLFGRIVAYVDHAAGG